MVTIIVALLSSRSARAEDAHPSTSPSPALLPSASASPLPFPVYVASRICGAITIDGKLLEPAWRETALGWGLSHSLEPNVLCPDPTLFRIGYDDTGLLIALACYKRDVQEDLPDHVWKPQESSIMDTQAVPRHARERGVEPPVNTAQVLLSRKGRTVTLTFAPPRPPAASVHDALGAREMKFDIEHASQGGPNDALWTAEARVTWKQLGFDAPAAGDDWALNVYRDIRFFSNWSFIAWMRDWNKAEYSRYDMTERFGRLIFAGAEQKKGSGPICRNGPEGASHKLDLTPFSVETFAKQLAARRGPVRVFTTDALALVHADGAVVRERYADRVNVLRAYAEGLRRERGRIGNDLPYYPFFGEKKPGAHLEIASRKLGRLYRALSEAPLFDDPACTVARISHAIPEAREGLYIYKKERLYRGLPE
jgi:hypothetical protein